MPAPERIGAHRPLRVLAWPARSGPSGNPYIDLLYDPIRADPSVGLASYDKRRLALGRWDIIHIHWPEWAARPSGLGAGTDTAQFVALLRLARLRGARVVWTAHNLRPHDGSAPASRLMRAFVREVDLVIGLSHASLRDAERRYPTLRGAAQAIVPHGHYRSLHPSGPTRRAAAREKLGLDHAGRTLLLLGQLRPYKNADRLIDVFRRVAADGDRLIVAGQPSSESMRRTLVAAAGDDRRVVLRLEHVPEDDLPHLFGAADRVVLPYRDMVNSGAALLALSLDRPVVAPNSGSLPELAALVGETWVQTYDGEFDETVLGAAITSPLPDGRPDLGDLGWEALSAATLDAYRTVTRRSRARHPRAR